MHSEETKQKIKDSQPRRRPVNAAGITYKSVSDAAKACGISATQIIWRIKNWDDWNYKDKE